MATFKVGQRVRFIGSCFSGAPPIGAEGVVFSLEADVEWDCVVDFPAFPDYVNRDLPPTHYLMDFSMLTPLTDPGADAFMERIKKLGSEPVNTVEKVTT
ncbi:hypothetical protein M0Q28_07085 [Patescibacteria group bacterium]|jgi:hypothetical protein|nr:hypothetical protein [Patescibacteria group bacterium]